MSPTGSVPHTQKRGVTILIAVVHASLRRSSIAAMALFLALWSCVPAERAAGQSNVPSKLQRRSLEYQRPAVIHFQGPIDYRRTEYLRNRIARVKNSGADLLILQIDSPGGLAVESLELAETLRDIDWAYTVAYVPREAISGAALISLGCDEIVMGSHASFGDVGPIMYDPQAFAFRYVPAKERSYLARQAQDLAESKGRPKQLAEAMIDDLVVVFRRQTADNAWEYRAVRLSDDAQKPEDAAKDAGLDVQVWALVADSGQQRFLTVNGPTAVDLQLASFVAADRAELISKLNVTGEISEHHYTTTDEVVYWLNLPVITGLLLVVGLIALYLELSAPGIGAGGLIAVLCATLFFWSRFLGGTSSWLEVILFVAGLAFLFMELFVIPGWGISGLTGLILIVGSVLMASQEVVIPQTNRQWNQFVTNILVILCSGCVVLIGAGYITRRLGNIPVFNRLILAPPAGEARVQTNLEKDTAKPLPATHPDVSVGDWGTSESLLRPAGRARFGQVSLDVVSDGSFIDPNRQVRVIEIKGNRIVVAEVENMDETVWQAPKATDGSV